MERGIEKARYTSPIATVVVTPLIMLLTAGILHVMFGLIGGGNGTYKQVYAISAHTAIITALQLVFTTVVTLAAGKAAGANLSVFTPTLEETTFVYRFLSTIDLFYVWSTFITAVGLAVLYKTPHRPDRHGAVRHLSRRRADHRLRPFGFVRSRNVDSEERSLSPSLSSPSSAQPLGPISTSGASRVRRSWPKRFAHAISRRSSRHPARCSPSGRSTSRRSRWAA